LPFPEADRLVSVAGTAVSGRIGQHALTEANLWEIRDRNRSFAGFGGAHDASFTLTGGSVPTRVDGARVTVGLFRALGVTAELGRLFVPGEDDPGAPGNLAMLSHTFWMRQYASDPGVLGRTILLDGQAYQVVGVLPPGSPWLDAAEVFVPLVRRPDANLGSWEYGGIARLKEGVSMRAALADMERIARDLAAADPKVNGGQGITLGSSNEWIGSESLRRTLWLLLGAVGLLLVIACVNVTNLLLARASGRAGETALRTALGATRIDLVRERITESLLLGGGGALCGWLVARLALAAVAALAPGGIPRLDTVALDVRALTVTIGIALAIGIIAGLVPALAAPVGDLVPVLRQSQRGSVGDRHSDRLRSLFVAAEVALSLTLLVGTGLLVRSLVVVLNADRGFTTDHRLVAAFSIPASYADQKREQIVLDVIDHIRALPGVVSVGYVSGRPLRGYGSGLGVVAADHDDIAPNDVPWASWRLVTEDYFTTMGLSVVAGRGFTAHDRLDVKGLPMPIVISQRLARLLWPGQDPIGRQAVLWKGQSPRPGLVLGVVQDMREQTIEGDPTLAIYFPGRGGLGVTQADLVIQTRDNPALLAPRLRSAVAAVDPTLPIFGIRTLEELVTRSVATRRFTVVLLGVFAGLALVLAVAGVYGVVAYTVARRTAEIGVRLALGATPGRVLRHAVVRGLGPVVIGVALGLIGVTWVSSLMSSLLVGVSAADPATYAAATAGLLATAALACYLPARQVLRVDPLIALRAE
jgi:predicted permease